MSWGPLIIDGVECTLHAYNEIHRLLREGKHEEAQRMLDGQRCAKTEEAARVESLERKRRGEDRPPPTPGLNRHERRRLAAKAK